MEFHNVLRLTTGRDWPVTPGTCIPGVWLHYRNGKPEMAVRIVMTTPQLHRYITMEMNKQYFVELVQAEGFFTLKINREQVWHVNSGSATFQNVKYYLSDPWHPSAGEVAIISTPKIWQG